MKRIIIFGMMATLLFFGYEKKEQGKEKTLISSASAAVDPFETNFSQFKRFLEEKDYLKSLESLRSLMKTFWKRSPFLLNNVKFVKSGDNSFGIYEPKEKEEFRLGERVYLYMEPSGYAFKKNPKGFNEFGFIADFLVEDKSGEILGGRKNFANLNFKSWNFNTEISITFTYKLSGLNKGRYKIVTTVKDKYSDKKATVENWINII